MSMLNSIKLFVKRNYYIFKISRYFLALFGYFKRRVESEVDGSWRNRTQLACDSPDNFFIDRVALAGTIQGDVQIMHNGLKIHVGSYYGDGTTVLLSKNKGVHEPEEEYAFNQILKHIPQGACMLELGAFWGFYSMYFQKNVKNAKNYLIEPDEHSMLSGINNFRLNKFKGNFFRYSIDDHSSENEVPAAISIDDFLERNSIARLDLLHSDIQGYELKMLQGASRALKSRKIDYFFISTHSNEIHEQCKSLLTDSSYIILGDLNLDETYSWDGLIVARRNELTGPDAVTIHKRKSHKSVDTL